jgi:hypothetical protein
MVYDHDPRKWFAFFFQCLFSHNSRRSFFLSHQSGFRKRRSSFFEFSKKDTALIEPSFMSHRGFSRTRASSDDRRATSLQREEWNSKKALVCYQLSRCSQFDARRDVVTSLRDLDVAGETARKVSDRERRPRSSNQRVVYAAQNP